MYNQQHFQKKLTIRQFREVLSDNLLKLEPTSRSSTIARFGENRSQRRQILKHKLEETEEKCQRNRKIRRRCTECYSKYSSELGYK